MESTLRRTAPALATVMTAAALVAPAATANASVTTLTITVVENPTGNLTVAAPTSAVLAIQSASASTACGGTVPIYSGGFTSTVTDARGVTTGWTEYASYTPFTNGTASIGGTARLLGTTSNFTLGEGLVGTPVNCAVSPNNAITIAEASEVSGSNTVEVGVLTEKVASDFTLLGNTYSSSLTLSVS